MNNEEQATTSPRERRSARTHDAIIDAARSMISEKGAHALSLRAIARQIEYSPAGLYEYFAGKDDIIAAVIADSFARFGDYLLSVPVTLPPLDYLRELGIAYLRFADEKPQHFMLIVNNTQLSPIPRNEDMVAAGTYGALVNALRRCIDAGLIPAKHDLNDLVFGTWGIVHGLATLRITQQVPSQTADWEPSARRLLDVWMAGLQNA